MLPTVRGGAGNQSLKNTIRDGDSTALYTAYTIYTAYTVNTVFTVYTIQTSLHYLNSSMYAYIYC